MLEKTHEEIDQATDVTLKPLIVRGARTTDTGIPLETKNRKNHNGSGAQEGQLIFWT